MDPGGKRGEVKFVGKAESLAAGYWVGVQYDEPVGKNDGMYDSDILGLQLYLWNYIVQMAKCNSS